MRFPAALAASMLLFGLASPGASAAPAPPAPNPSECKVGLGGPLPDFWPKNRLKFDRAWQVTRGAGVLVAVIDSGLNTEYHPQLKSMRTVSGTDVIPYPGFAKRDTRDCDGHGTAVTSIIAAQPREGVDYVGIAPEVTILPIKQTQKKGDSSGTSETIGTALEAAVRAGARVVNISITTPVPTPQLEAAIKDAAANDVVVVAAGGNDGSDNENRTAYPAAYATTYHNVIAVSASNDKDEVPNFSTSGSYITVAAPGVEVPVAAAVGDGYRKDSGTSFATPYVTGTAALLRSAFRTMTAAQVRNRIVATADAPPADRPDDKYGYGIVNPVLAVTAVRNDDSSSAAAQAPQPLRRLPDPALPSRHLEHLALGSAAILLGLIAIAFATTAVLRARGRRPLQRVS